MRQRNTSDSRNSSEIPFNPISEKGNRKLTRRELLQMVIPNSAFPPPGRIMLDKMRCSACTLCVRECTNGALTANGTESLSLIFRQELCDSCGLCLAVCPEQCLTLERGDGEVGTVVLFEGEVARCPGCGTITGSKAMIERVRSKLGITSAALITELQLCPECKGMKVEET